MRRNNIRLLTDSEYERLTSKFIFGIKDDKISVMTTSNSRVTLHDIGKPFHINAKKIRKICFSLDAIEIWKTLYKDGYPHLIDVQQAVNKLIITYQEVTEENVKKMLAKKTLKIKNI